jgi:dTDP-glucose 4,6-dehydratase/UDP-glucose 4-epimerase
MNLLILGSEGFIGQNAVEYFQARGYNVYSADIVLKQSPNYFLINPEHSDFSTIFIKHKFDACINATGAANVQLSFTNPAIDFALNTANVYEILNSIKEHNPGCRFMNLSSAAVYGNPEELPIRENTEIKPLSPYGCHKLYSEQICKEFFDFFQIPTISVRIFSAYGEGLKKQLFWDLYKKIENSDGQIEVFGTGKESRDFIYIKDLLLAIELILKSAEFKGSVINVASGVESTIEEAVNCFVSCFKIDIKVKFGGRTKVGDPINWRADISMLESLGFKHQYSLKDGVYNYYKWLTGKRLL